MDIFDLSCIDFEEYPLNLPRHDVSLKKVKNLAKQLDHLSEKLFSDDPRLGFWDLYRESKTFELKRAKSLEDVQRLCPWTNTPNAGVLQHTLACRFIFLHSEDSRSPLYTTREMLMLALSYHLVVPWFLDFLFMFGEQTEQRDFRFSAFRHKTHRKTDHCLSLPKLGRSGHEMHVCYNLKWPEVKLGKSRPWSIRQTVTYNIFDLQTAAVFWIVLKGNDSMSKDLREETQRWNWKDSKVDPNRLEAFRACLKTHLFICESSCETWRAYISYLENQMNSLTRETIILREHSRFQRWNTPPQRADDEGEFPRSALLSKMGRFLAKPQKPQISIDPEKVHSDNANYSDRTEKLSRVVSPDDVQPSNYRPPQPSVEFSKLQEATGIDERANEALLAIKNNIEIMRSLAKQYDNDELQLALRNEIPGFASQLNDMINDLEMYHVSLENLLRTFTERKNLVLAILQHRNMEANEIFAEEAQQASLRMETMSKDMRDLAKKTKRETLSMSVIAGVTMFYLPGTFVSTLMSTPLFEHSTVTSAWHWFLALTLPLMTLTFVSWIILTIWFNKKDSAKK